MLSRVWNALSSNTPRRWRSVWGRRIESLLAAALLFSAAAASPAAAQTPTVDEIVALLQEAYDELDDIQLTVRMKEIHPRDGTVSEGRVDVTARMPDLIRLTYHEPEIWTGMIVVIDYGRDRTHWYQPILNRTYVMSVERFLIESQLPVRPEDLLVAPSPDDFLLEIVGTQTQGGSSLVLLEARLREQPDDGRIVAWVDLDNRMIARLEGYNASGALQVVVDIDGVKKNVGVSAAELRRTPPGADIVHR